MPVAEQAALPARIPSLFRIAARLRLPVAELSTGTCEVPFFAAALMPSAGINLHQSPVHIRAPRALTWGIQMMKFPRRRFLHLATGAAALPAVSRISWAQTYPSRPISIVVPFPAGGATDVVTRVLAKGLSDRLGQSVVVDNRPGANGAIGSASVARARPDGHTLVMGGVNTHAMNDSLLKPRPYDSAKDFAPITLTAIIPIAFAVNPKLPVATLQELVTLARSKPRQLSYGSSGTGGPHHLAMELFKLAAGVDIVHVPYKGGAPQLNDLIGGHILIGSIGLPPALPHIEAGKLRALAVTDAKRSMLLPMLQTVAESGWPGFEVSYWLGLMAPAGTPRDIIDRLATESVAVLTTRDTRESLAGQGAEVVTSTPDELKKLVEKDVEKWSKIIQETGITAE